MSIEELFTHHLLPTTEPQIAINDLATIIDAEPAAEGSETYYAVDDNEIRCFFDNSNFYITGINEFNLDQPVQFDY